ncbi:methionine synthase reductase-like [Corticium candelabrum]|uniref:methionine synthase reductase-like n=1 Tax=Corticium candelabrum TaxID=121492 RepID=UPI002E271540|nr:methionine synthase reductase-like [Corticium candelabrum]
MIRRFLILYASQTGQAEAIAKSEIYTNAFDHDLSPVIFCMSQTDRKFNLEEEPVVVIVASTTGDGDPPDTAGKFWRRIKKSTVSKTTFKNLKFALLGLGDSNYTNFCNFSKMLNKRLTELGATPFYDTGYADDAVGLERVVEPWTEGLFPALKKLLGVPIAPSENNEENGVALDSTQVEKQKQHDGTEITSEHGTMLEARKLSSLVSRKGSPRTCFSASSSPKLERVASPEGKKASLSVAGAGQPTASSLSVHRGSVDMSTMSSVNMARNSFSDLSVAPKSPGLGKKGGKKTVIAWQYGGAGKSKERRTSAVPVANSTTQESSKKKVGEKTRSSAAQGDASGGVKSSSKTEASEELHNTKQLVNVMEALKESLPALKGVRLNLPALRPEKFIVEYPKGASTSTSFSSTKQFAKSYPSQATDLFMAPITGCQQLTRDDAVKTALEVELDTKGSDVTYSPGDSFGIVCENDPEEVKWLIDRLHLPSNGDALAEIKIAPNPRYAEESVPVHLPTPWTPRGWLQNCCDIRSVPGKMFLRVLAEYTSEAKEKNRIEQLCSKQGSQEFSSRIRDNKIFFIDILEVFPSCLPPLNVVLEGLPRLKPRYYSVASSPLSSKNKVKCVFNVVNLPPKGSQPSRKGLCTGWLQGLTQPFRRGYDAPDQSTATVTDPPKVPMYLRSNNRFNIPDDPSVPLVMIGPGTGIAPFVGFLRHRYQQQTAANANDKKAANATDKKAAKFGETWLFYGCRHKDRDFLYKKQLDMFVASGTLSHLHVVFSRDEGQPPDAPRYVQHAMKRHATALVNLIMKKNSSILVCGDAKNMARDVMVTLTELVGKHTEMSNEEAGKFLYSLREAKRYCEDVWT